MIKLLLIVVVLVAIAFILLGINIFLFRRKFPETEIGRNKDMIKLGLTCPHCEERKIYEKRPVVRASRIKPELLKPDWSKI